MADNRKYYYLKLKESYFDDDAIVLLESMQDGVIYSNILLKLYLKSLKNGGKLQLDENIPYTAQMIATITRQQVGTVERALKIFMKLGLVEPLPSGALYMSNIELLIGQSSTEKHPDAGPVKCPGTVSRGRKAGIGGGLQLIAAERFLIDPVDVLLRIEGCDLCIAVIKVVLLPTGGPPGGLLVDGGMDQVIARSRKAERFHHRFRFGLRDRGRRRLRAAHRTVRRFVSAGRDGAHREKAEQKPHACHDGTRCEQRANPVLPGPPPGCRMLCHVEPPAAQGLSKNRCAASAGQESDRSDQIAHIIQPRLLLCQIHGGVDGAVGKDAAGISSVLEGDHFVRAAEQHLVVAHDAASAHGADADLLRVTLLTHGGAIVDIVVSTVVLLVDGIGQHQSSAAGGIQLVVVMLLHDLYVIVHAQNGRSTLAQFRQHVDAHGHVGALEHGHRA